MHFRLYSFQQDNAMLSCPTRLLNFASADAELPVWVVPGPLAFPYTKNQTCLTYTRPRLINTIPAPERPRPTGREESAFLTLLPPPVTLLFYNVDATTTLTQGGVSDPTEA